MRTLVLLGVAVLAVGCSRREVETYRAELVRITTTPGEKACVDRLLAQSRFTGYIEQTVDKEAGFFRVVARNQQFQLGLDKKGRPTNRISKGELPAQVTFYNVQCVDELNAVVTPMNANGVVTAPYVLDAAQNGELQSYARSLGTIWRPQAQPAAQPDAPPQVQGVPPKCVASESPEWATANAAKKKELLDACR